MMRPRSAKPVTQSRFWCPAAMRDELSHALMEALYELEVLPDSEEGALMGLYAVMDDLEEAIHRTAAIDVRRSA